jgi:ABC-2 type transport system ATP-binding protein
MTPAVRVENLRKRYGRVVAADGISFEVASGEMFGLIGPDGAGKSTVLKTVAGVLAHDSGTVSVLDVLIDSEQAAERMKAHVGFMPQGLGLNLYGDLSVEENIDFFARLRLVPPELLAERKRKLLAATRLTPFLDRPMKNLSGGMKQKLGLICTLIHGPQLIILDEPSTGVDPVSRQDFWTILTEQVAEAGMTALVSTAYMDEATRFDRIALCYGGRVLTHGRPEELLRAAEGVIVQITAPRAHLVANKLAEQFPQQDQAGSVLRVFVPLQTQPAASTDPPQQAMERVRAQLTSEDYTQISVAQPDLEDIYIAGLRAQPDTPPLLPLAYPAASHADAQPVIEARELVRTFGQFRAVDRVTFNVHPGEIFGLLGANGAGKTTVIKMLTGLLAPTSGSGRVAGVDMLRARLAIRERMGYMSQAFSLYLDLTVLENIHLFAGIYGLPSRLTRERIDWVLETAALRGVEHMRVANLPMGMRQRLALGCAVLHRPPVLFLDEPTSGVDPIGRRQFWRILFQLARTDGVAVLLTTHFMSEAERCDRLALMFAGRIVADDTPDGLKQAVAAEAGELYEIDTDQPLLAQNALREAGFQGVSLHGRRVHALVPAEDARRQIERPLNARGITLKSATRRALSMEDVFVYRVLKLESEARAGKVA